MCHPHSHCVLDDLGVDLRDTVDGVACNDGETRHVDNPEWYGERKGRRRKAKTELRLEK